MNKTPEQQFKYNLISFIEFATPFLDDIEDVSENTLVFVTYFNMLINSIEPRFLINKFIKHTTKYWYILKTSNCSDDDIEFFIDIINDKMKDNIYLPSINVLLRILINNIGNEDKNVFWDYMYSFMRNGISYMTEHKREYKDDIKLLKITWGYK